MSEPKTIACPTGAKLTIQQPSFSVAKALYQSLFSELNSVQIVKDAVVLELYKQAFAIGFSSPLIEEKLWECMKLCRYGNGSETDRKIDKDTFEDLKAREDWLFVCVEVAVEVTAPFLKPLSVAFRQFQTIMPNIPTS